MVRKIIYRRVLWEVHQLRKAHVYITILMHNHANAISDFDNDTNNFMHDKSTACLVLVFETA